MTKHNQIAPKNRADVVRVRREMAITQAQFIRLLEPALGPAPFEVNGRSIVVDAAAGKVEIRLSSAPQQGTVGAIAPLSVEIELTGFSHTDFQSFMDRFDKAFEQS